MKTKFIAFYSGDAVNKHGYGTQVKIRLKDVISECGKFVYYNAIFASRVKGLKSLSPKNGDLISFKAIPQVSGLGVVLLRPSEFKKEEFEINFRELFAHFYKNFDDAANERELFVAKRLFRRYPNPEFWKTYSLGFQLNSLGFFLTASKMQELRTEYEKFIRPKIYSPPEPEIIALSGEKLGEDLNLDYKKIKKPLYQRF